MSLDVETVLERRRMRRQIGLWRGLAIAAGVLVLLAFVGLQARDSGLLANQQIARVAIDGLITEDRKQLEMFERISKADHVRGVIVHINSPGGTTTGGEALFQAIRELAEKKPVAAQFGTVAASAAYIAGLATDHIVARGNSITGSVGVIVQWPELSGLLDKLGVKYNVVRSGQLKAEPSAFEPISPEGERVIRQMIEDGQDWFVGLVRERREIDPAQVPGLLEGRTYSGRMALTHRLIDEIGAEDEAIAWMTRERDVPKGLKVVDWTPQQDFDWPLGGASSTVARWVFGKDADELLPTSVRALGLDGLLSIWHLPKN